MVDRSQEELSDLNALARSAFLAHREGRFEEAISTYQRLIGRGAESVELHSQLAFAEHAAGKLSAAIKSMRRALALSGSSANATLQNNLGGMLLEKGDLDAAADAFAAALRTEPDHRNALFNLGVVEQRRRRFAAAARCFERLIARHGAEPNVVNNLATAFLELGEHKRAIALLQQSCAAAPDPRSYNNLGLAHRAAGELQQAQSAFRQALALAPDFADAHNNFGNLFLELGDGGAATMHLRRATELSPRVARFHSNLGNALHSTGQFDEAAMSLRRALTIDPEFAAARRHLSLAAQASESSRQMRDCLALLEDSNLSNDERAHLHFALGRLYDQQHHYQQAFEHYRQGNALVRASILFSIDDFYRHATDVMRVFDREFLSRAANGQSSRRPVFVVGMPRSGTSLVEQILASHSEVYGAGELAFFVDLEDRVGLGADGQSYPFSVDELGSERLRKIADEYLSVLDLHSRDALYVVDKQPSNALRLGLIQLVFPNARVIWCTRDPMDIGISNYFQYFIGSQKFAYDLYEIGATIGVHEQLLAHWRQHLALPFLEVSYEALVDDLELSTRRIAEFLELEFEPECLAFHRTERTVRTASSWQVRQPLYSSSVGRWRSYRQHLAQLIEGLEAGRGMTG